MLEITWTLVIKVKVHIEQQDKKKELTLYIVHKEGCLTDIEYKPELVHTNNSVIISWQQRPRIQCTELKFLGKVM